MVRRMAAVTAACSSSLKSTCGITLKYEAGDREEQQIGTPNTGRGGSSAGDPHFWTRDR
jgi:hypothetical protein